MQRSTRKLAEPDLGVLATRLLLGIEGELSRRTAEQGFDDLRPRHGAVPVAGWAGGGCLARQAS